MLNFCFIFSFSPFCLETLFMLFIYFTLHFSDEDSTSSLPGLKTTSESRTSTPEPNKFVFKDKKEAIEAFKELLKERVCLLLNHIESHF